MGRVAVSVFDALGFVNHAQVEHHVGFGNHIFIAHHTFIIGNGDRRIFQSPQPATAVRVAFDGGNGNFRCPHGKLSLPVVDQRFGTHQQHPPHFASPQQQANGGDGLHGFAQPHFVGN